MKEIVTILKPFMYLQNVFVYEDGKKIEVLASSLDDLSNNIFELSNKYDTNKVNLIGNIAFGKGIKEQILEAEMTKYNANNLDISCISK